MSPDILEAADAAAWYAAEHRRAHHDADALTGQRPTGLRARWQRWTEVARMRRRARLAGHLATQARADHDRLLQVLVQEVEYASGAVPLRADPGAELMDRLTDALHAHRAAVQEAALHTGEAKAARWWQNARKEAALLRTDYANDCAASHWERVQKVRVEVNHHVSTRLPR